MRSEKARYAARRHLLLASVIACARGVQTKKAMGQLRSMKTQDFHRNGITHNALINPFFEYKYLCIQANS